MIPLWFIYIFLHGLLKTFWVCGQSITLTNWTQASATLSVPNMNLAAAYNENSSYPECIFVYGGRYTKNVHCYNYTSDQLIFWGALDGSLGSNFRAQPAGLIISNTTHDLLYYATRGCEIVQYDLQNKISTTLDSSLKDVGWKGCPLVQNPLNNNQFFTLDGYTNSSQTGVYDLVSNNITYGKNLNTSVFRPFVVVIDDDFNKIVYVMTGQTNAIQKLNLSKSNNISEIEWETLSVTLTVSETDCDVQNWSHIFATGGVQYKNFIYIVGGQDSTSTRSCIIAFDWIDETVQYIGNYPIPISRYGYA